MITRSTLNFSATVNTNPAPPGDAAGPAATSFAPTVTVSRDFPQH